MAVLPADVTARAKEFATLGDPEIQAAIDDALLQLNPSVWGTKLDLATIYLAAHNLSVQNPSMTTAVGPVQSEKVGEISRTYAVAVAPSTGYAATKWGREYERLLKQLLGARVL